MQAALELRPWQEDFVAHYVSRPPSKSVLIAAPGSGKTAMALVTGRRMLSQGIADSILLISDRLAIQAQWREVAQRYDLNLSTELLSSGRHDGTATTVQYLQRADRAEELRHAATSQRLFIVADEMARSSQSVYGLVDAMLTLNPGGRALFIASQMPRELPAADAEGRFPSVYLLNREAPPRRETETQIALYAPSYSLLQQFQNEPSTLDQLSWRAFEKLIAGLLERDGYTVELMQGSKDGGVDIVASKELGAHGCFRALWQAKKKAIGNKVGISVVRELADTRDQFGASKGIIVTSTYLTKGAIERIDRDKFILGKVDRDDIDAWIRRTLLRGVG
jgi:hypothetical protein